MSVTVVSKHLYDLGEGPFWDNTSESLFHADSFVGDYCKLNPRTGETEVVHLDGGLTTVIIPYTSHPNKLLVTLQKLILKLDWNTKQTELLAEVEPEIARSRFNDGKCDARGRFWVGTVLEKKEGGITEGGGNLHSMDPNLKVKTHNVKGVTLSNGMAWSLDNKTMFFNDSEGQKIFAFDFNLSDGSVSNQRIMVDFNSTPGYKNLGYPDGMTIDTEGKLWVACFAGSRVLRIDPETSKLLQQVEFPAQNITSCCFGGSGYEDLYVTSAWRGLSEEQLKAQPKAGAVFKVTGLGVKGFPANTFQG